VSQPLAIWWAEEVVNSDATALQHWGECSLMTGDASTSALRLQAASRWPRRIATSFTTRRRIIHGSALRAGARRRQGNSEDGKSLPDGNNLRGTGETFGEAIAAFRKASDLNPKDEQNYVDLASLCLEHQSFDVAREVVNAGIANIPDSGALFTLRGAIAAQTSDVEHPRRTSERARRLEPNASYGDVGLSLLLRQGDQIDQAAALIPNGWLHNPGDAPLISC